MEGVVKDVVPEANNVPPDVAEYQSMVSPAPGVADNVTVPVPQREAGVPVGAAGIGLTVATTAVLVETQPVAVVCASA